MTQLSVNVNKLATLRNSREKNNPDVASMAKKILGYGAHGITVHPRPDGRHIRTHDVHEIHELITKWNSTAGQKKVEFNIEGYPSDEFLEMIGKVRPHQCTLVPDPPEALTSNAGWDLVGETARLTRVLGDLRKMGVRASLFVEPAIFDEAQAQALVQLRPDRIELYTEAYADHFTHTDRAQVTEDYARVARVARTAGVGVNAGHDLNQENLGYLVQAIPWIDEVSIGHALICEALEQGLEQTIHSYLKILQTS